MKQRVRYKVAYNLGNGMTTETITSSIKLLNLIFWSDTCHGQLMIDPPITKEELENRINSGKYR
jgi:hypothetical protein